MLLPFDKVLHPIHNPAFFDCVLYPSLFIQVNIAGMHINSIDVVSAYGNIGTTNGKVRSGNAFTNVVDFEYLIASKENCLITKKYIVQAMQGVHPKEIINSAKMSCILITLHSMHSNLMSYLLPLYSVNLPLKVYSIPKDHPFPLRES